MDVRERPQDWRRFADRFNQIQGNVERVVRGKDAEIRLALVALIAEGHLLIEDVPGVGKTMLAKAIARSIDCSFRRIQFTPDLLPTDVTGVNVFNQEQHDFEFKPGAIFANIVVGDEINRASPKTQAALLEAMEERQVTTDGKTKLLPEPFMVVATQNPIEHEGTYPLPEAQLDRFMMRVSVGYPSRDKELEMLETHSLHSTFEDLVPVVDAREVAAMIEIARRVEVVPAVRSYIIDIVDGTRRHPEVLLGASPRSALYLQKAARARAASEGRDYVTPDDVKVLAPSVLEHRLAFRPEAQMRGVTSGELLASVIGSIRIPIYRTG